MNPILQKAFPSQINEIFSLYKAVVAGAVVERFDLFKLERHNTVFPEECKKVFELGVSLVK